MWSAAVALTLVHAAVAFTPLYDLFVTTVFRLPEAMVLSRWRMIKAPIARNVRHATQRSTNMKSANTDSSHVTPRTASRGQIMSPTTTPSANGQAA